MGSKLAEVTAAARTFVRSSNQEDEMFVVNFNENVSLGLPRTTRFTNSAAELEYAITTAPAEARPLFTMRSPRRWRNYRRAAGIRKS